MIVKKKMPIKSYEIFSESDYQEYRQPLVTVVLQNECKVNIMKKTFKHEIAKERLQSWLKEENWYQGKDDRHEK